MEIKKAGIIGLGLIGGSLAKVLKNRMRVETIAAQNRSEDALKAAYDEGFIDMYSTETNEIFKDCDIVFICTPVNLIAEYAKKLIPFTKKDCIITDVGSTKGRLYDRIKPLEDNFYYIGGHPMTGSEKSRYQASKEHLFENAYYILAPAENVPDEKIMVMKDIVTSFGAIPVIVSPFQHDHIVAAISHVPQIIASALCNNVKKLDDSGKHMHQLAAGGFKDITRIASSNADMWEGILFENQTEILSVLSSLEDVIASLKTSLVSGNHQQIHNYFDEAHKYRDTFSNITPGSFVKRYEISVDVLDKPGSIAIISVLLSSHGLNIKNMSIVNNRERENGALKIAFDSEEQRTKSIALLNSMNYEVYKND